MRKTIIQLGGCIILLLASAIIFSSFTPTNFLSPDCANPTFPGCQMDGEDVFRVCLVIDESGSINNLEESQVEDAVTQFAQTLNSTVASTGIFEMGIVEFGTSAGVGLTMTDVKHPTFLKQVSDYLINDYSPLAGNLTNFTAALNTVSAITDLDMIFFISDGNPTTGGTAVSDWKPIADQLKCDGTYIFGIGLGDGLDISNIQQVSGPDEWNNPLSLVDGADWTQEDFDGLSECLVVLANSLIDREAPTITCAAPIEVNCEQSTDPTHIGEPIALDNCGIDQLEHNDEIAPGDCPNQFTINRKWTATDFNNNESTCFQVINVVDNAPPALNIPDDVTVSCDTSTATAGMATVMDNCPGEIVLTYTDQVIGGDCEWQCQIARTWTAEDACGNLVSHVQNIEKNVLPLLISALSVDLDNDGFPDPLIMGKNNTNLDFGSGVKATECVLKLLPYNGSTPKSLERGEQVVTIDCVPGTNPIDVDGYLTNPLLGEAIKLSIILRLNPDLKEVPVSDFDCDFAAIVEHSLSDGADIREFHELVQIALANLILQMPPHPQELLDAIICINSNWDICSIPTTP